MAGKAAVQSRLDVFLLGVLEVFFLTVPGLQGRSLQGTMIREGHGPRLVQRALVEGIPTDGSLFLALTSRRKGMPGTAGGTGRRGAAQRSNSGKRNFFIFGDTGESL